MAAIVSHDEPICGLGPIDLIPPGEGRSFQVNGLSVTIFRSRSGRLFGTQSLCPHREGPLADGILGDDKIVCPLHAYKFDLNTGNPVGNDCSRLVTYPVTVNSAGEMRLHAALPQLDSDRVIQD